MLCRVARLPKFSSWRCCHPAFVSVFVGAARHCGSNAVRQDLSQMAVPGYGTVAEATNRHRRSPARPPVSSAGHSVRSVRSCAERCRRARDTHVVYSSPQLLLLVALRLTAARCVGRGCRELRCTFHSLLCTGALHPSVWRAIHVFGQLGTLPFLKRRLDPEVPGWTGPLGGVVPHVIN
jgi:hypothetical protein